MSSEEKAKIADAKSVDLLDFIHRMGYQTKPNGGNEHMLAEHDSLKISNNLWYWHSQGLGGSAIDFAMHFPQRNCRDFHAAVDYVVETMCVGRSREAAGQTRQEKKTDILYDNRLAVGGGVQTVKLPEKENCPARVYAYLCSSRGIDNGIVRDAINAGSLYQSKGSNNCVFVGKDADGVARYGFQRGTLSERRFARDCDGSDKSYGFTMPAKNADCNTVYVYESAIDAMSHATLDKRSMDNAYRVHRLSLGGVSEKALERFLDEYPKVYNVVMCLDNDPAGRDATTRIRNKLSERAVFHSEPPRMKDYNEDLKQLLTPKQKGMTI